MNGKAASIGPSQYLDIGVLELNLGRGGVTAKIGTGGIDVGGSLYDAAKRGLDYASIMSYADDTENGKKRREAALLNYIVSVYKVRRHGGMRRMRVNNMTGTD
jgi:hypothetical protein